MKSRKYLFFIVSSILCAPTLNAGRATPDVDAGMRATSNAPTTDESVPPAAMAATLEVPVPGHYTTRIEDDQDRKMQFFTWEPANLDRMKRRDKTWPEDYYRLCLFHGDSCEQAQTRQVIEVTPGINEIPPYRYRPSDHQLPASLAFQESDFKWAIAACVRDSGQCSDYSKPLTISWTQPRLPVHNFPKAGAVRDPMIATQFRWDATADVDHYLLCLTKPGTPCADRAQTQSEDMWVIEVPNSRRDAHLIELLQAAGEVTPYRRARLHGQEMEWSAAVCREGECKYRSPAMPIRFDRGLAKLRVRNVSKLDVDQVWLVGPDQQRQLITPDLSSFLPPASLSTLGGSYRDTYLTHIQRHHLGIEEPSVTPYYRIEYTQQLENAPYPGYAKPTLTSVAFAPGVIHVPEYQIVSETLNITDDGSYFEQVLRSEDGQRYVYRPGGAFPQQPDAGQGPVPLSILRDQGYRVR